MFSGALGGMAASLVVSLATVSPPKTEAPPSPPGPRSPASKQLVIAPAPALGPGHFLLHQPRARALFTDTGLALHLAPSQRPARGLRWGVVGARTVVPQPLQPREARFHWRVGAPEAWAENLPTWGALYYPGVAPGVDLWFEARDEGIEYSLRAQRGADLRKVRLEWRGAEALRVAEGGRALEVVLADGQVREEGLRCGQENADGTSVDVPCRYREVRRKGTGRWEYVIEVDVREPRRPAWVDPTVRWGTFLGSNGFEALEDITSDADGNSYVIGSSGDTSGTGFDSMDPPLGNGFEFGLRGRSDVVLAKFARDGALHWLAVFGGSGNDFGKAVALSPDWASVYFAGTTFSADMPGVGGVVSRGLPDGFVGRIRADGNTNSADWIRYVGGELDEDVHDIDVAPDGKVYAVGGTRSTLVPGTADAGTKGGRDLFVSRFTSAGVLETTLLRGGTSDDEAYAVVAERQEPAGGLFVSGSTQSSNYPVDSPPKMVRPDAGGRDAVAFKVDLNLGTFRWLAFPGGQGTDDGFGIAEIPGPPSRVVFVGTTRSIDFPGAVDAGTTANVFMVGFNPTSGDRQFSTVVGGSADEDGLAAAAGLDGTFYVGGKTLSPSLPGAGLNDSTAATQGFVLQMETFADGGVSGPSWGTFLGGVQFEDEVRALDFSAKRQLLIGGTTRSSDILSRATPLANGYDTAFSQNNEMFLFAVEVDTSAPPGGTELVLDGLTVDLDEQNTDTVLQAGWSTFRDPESDILQYELGVGTTAAGPDFKAFFPVGVTTSRTLTYPGDLPNRLTVGQRYFLFVRATNAAGLSTIAASDGVRVTYPDGGLPPDAGTPDAGLPDGGPDGGGGLPDGGGPGGGTDPEDEEATLGWSCSATGGPGGLALLVFVVLGLMGARLRRADSRL